MIVRRQRMEMPNGRPDPVPGHGRETPRWSLRGERRGVKLVVPDLRRRSVLVSFHDPGLIVAVPEREQRLAQLLDGVEVAQPQQVLLHGPDEALGTAIALRGAHERRRTLALPDRLERLDPGGAGPLGWEQAMLAHQPQDAAARGAHAGKAQPRPDLAVTLAGEAADADH